MFFNVLLLVLSLHLCAGQTILFGACENVETMKYFELERFLGKWYEIERIPSWYDDDAMCSYKIIQRCGRRIEFQHGFVKDSIQYILHVNSTYTPGAEAVFDIQKNNIDPFGIPLSIITTDYTNYAIMYGCKVNPELNLKYVLAWVLSRNKTLSSKLLDEAHQRLMTIPSTSLAYFHPVSHSEKLCDHMWSAHVHAHHHEADNDSLAET
ncbi:lopap-like [Danaus plexippus]|uniref:lopap-like n=1 Tax=Danaus plexippus TaxID=13037 RepID=UPI002AB0C60F|nr:lopap-like [Danaus plexippus]